MKKFKDETLDQFVNKVKRQAKKAGRPYSREEETALRGDARDRLKLKNPKKKSGINTDIVTTGHGRTRACYDRSFR